MKKCLQLMAKFRLDDLSKNFLSACGVAFIMINVMDYVFTIDGELFGGFIGQVFFCLAISISSTYFSSATTKDQGG